MKPVHSTPPESLYRRITAEIIRAIEEAPEGAYQMPWHRNTADGFPQNAFTGHPYHGFNTLSLWAAKDLRCYPTSLWATYRQWQELGAQVKRGEKSVPVLFFKREEVREPETSSEPPRSILKVFSVFNADQVDGWRPEEISEGGMISRIDEAEQFIASIGASVRFGGTSAYYSRTTDHIQMPPRGSFVGTDTSTATESFYAVLFHEHVHWTGHETRLDRDLSGRFGEDSYAMEELVAELGAAFLCAELRIADAPRQDHALYMRSWLPVLREKPSALIIAASSAMKACRFLGEMAK